MPTEQYLKRFEKKETKPRWAIIQDEKEKEFAKNHKKVQWDIINTFYFWLNQDPVREDTWQCFVRTLKGKGYRQGIIREAYKVFVRGEDLPKNPVNIYKAVA